MRNFIHTSESVTAGHPDKLCDLISDSIVDAFLAADPPRPVNAECTLASGIVFLAVRCLGEPQTDLAALVRRDIADVGYTHHGFNSETCTIMTNVSPDPSFADLGPGKPLHVQHSATLFGYACRQTTEFMPLPIVAARRLTRGLDTLRVDGGLSYLTPDCQSQVAVEFKDRQPVRIHNIGLTIATDVEAGANAADIERELREHLVSQAFDHLPIAPDSDTRIMIQQVPTGSEGLASHAGLTGRKSAVDGYGGFARQGSAALSGKDPSRIDRTAAYAARHIAKCVVAADLAKECEVQLSYCAGEDAPISLEIDSFGSGSCPDAEISARVRNAFDLTVDAIAERYHLWTLPSEHDGRFYAELAVSGHMGRIDIDVPWEDISAAADLAN